MKKSNIIRVLISILLIYLMLNTLEIKTIKQLVSNFSVKNILLFIIIFSIIVPLLSLRWFLIFNKGVKNFTYFDIVKITYEGFFLNQLLPAPISGDAYRYLIGKDKKTNPKYINSIIFDRLVGVHTLLMSLIVLATIIIAKKDIYSYFLIFFLTLITHLLFYFILKNYISSNFFSKSPKSIKFFFVQFLNIVRKKKFFLVMTFSFIERFIIMLLFMIILSSFLHDLEFYQLIKISFFFNISLFIASIPISLGGWGVREGTFLYFGSKINENLEVLFVTSTFFGIILFLISFPGFFMLIKNRVWKELLNR